MSPLTEKEKMKLNMDSEIKKLTKQRDLLKETVEDLTEQVRAWSKKLVTAKEDAEKIGLDIRKREKQILEDRQTLVNVERDLKDEQKKLQLKIEKQNAIRDQLNLDASVYASKSKKLESDEKELNARLDGITDLEKKITEKTEALDIREKVLDQRLEDIKEREAIADQRESHVSEKLAKINSELDRIEKDKASLSEHKVKLEGDFVDKCEKLQEKYSKQDKIISAEKDALKKRELALIDAEKKIEMEYESIKARKDELKLAESRKKR